MFVNENVEKGREKIQIWVDELKTRSKIVLTYNVEKDTEKFDTKELLPLIFPIDLNCLEFFRPFSIFFQP